jgi:hypothetical protein
MKYLIALAIFTLGMAFGIYVYEVQKSACYMWVDMTIPGQGIGLYTVDVPCGIDQAYHDRFVDDEMSNWEYLKFNYRDLTR